MYVTERMTRDDVQNGFQSEKWMARRCKCSIKDIVPSTFLAPTVAGATEVTLVNI